MASLLQKIFGSRNDRILKQYQKQLVQINALEPAMAAFKGFRLKELKPEFRADAGNPAARSLCRGARSE